MNTGPRGISAKAHSTVSLSMWPQRNSNSCMISRSQSFTGVSSKTDRTRHLAAFHTPTVSRKAGSRVRRMFSVSHKSPLPKVPQPERVDEVYDALKKGLGAYLEVHQMELDKLTGQIRDSKRNSRLGFLYDLDKQVKSVERFICRLEFHTSKIDELYESYCIHRRLRDGAHNMVKAYSASPGSKEARESLSEAGKGYKEYTEKMCVLENDLESQLGEFHIKMKGLAGFARLCVGDQYEIFMKYGRQRWRLKGRIEVNGKQVWDSEEMVLLPLITEFLSIKVSEVKSLANHVLVGSVSCETKDLFAALPQVVAVDINDLGTIKLSLEVNWNPFDKDDQTSASSTVNKSTVNKRLSTYNPSPPDTPSLREQAFYNMIRRQDEHENGAAWSISSESSDDSSSPQLSSSARRAPKEIVQPEVQDSPPDIEIAFLQRGDPWNRTGCAATQDEDDYDQNVAKETVEVKKGNVADGYMPYSRTLSHISEVSFDAGDSHTLDGPVITRPDDTVKISLSNEDAAVMPITGQPQFAQEFNFTTLSTEMEANLVQDSIQIFLPMTTERLKLESSSSSEAVTLVDAFSKDLRDTHVRSMSVSPFPCLDTVLEKHESSITDIINAEAVKTKPVDIGLNEAFNSLNASLDDYRGQFPELQALDRGVQHLEKILMLRKGVLRSRVPSLTVENVLESFDFLNTASDIDDSECSEEEGARNVRNMNIGQLAEVTDSECEGSTQDNTICSDVESNLESLSTGNEHLDEALVMHLNNCSRLLLNLGKYGPLRCREMYALDKLMREAQNLEVISRLSAEKSKVVITAEDVVQFSVDKEGVMPFWNECVQPPDVYISLVETFVHILSSHYAEQINAQQEGLADAVFTRLVEEILDRKLPKQFRTTYRERLTIFQYWQHFETLSISSLDAYIQELAYEELFIQNVNSDDQTVVLKALKRVSESIIQKKGFKTLSLLLTNGSIRVIAAITSLLRGFSEHQKFRERALVCFLEQLEDEDTKTRIAGCAALGCLKAKESIDQLVFLCQTDKDVKDAAMHSLMLLGYSGYAQTWLPGSLHLEGYQQCHVDEAYERLK
ncbi:rho family-interacting cell polarization regulator 1 isoform X2 [Spea bombifrons]|uniref:rho family-interacting cell polarization regulator 1 isoform X2 n=1 Tax=Spea bombifrons TaxID=233779 RepID=UPI00234976FD|nr:rho family-interacting cell polarization regulator 1 isoform X2 [Spea bombifrons]